MVETQLCKLRDTSDALVGRAIYIFLVYFIFIKNEKRQL